MNNNVIVMIITAVLLIATLFVSMDIGQREKNMKETCYEMRHSFCSICIEHEKEIEVVEAITLPPY